MAEPSTFNSVLIQSAPLGITGVLSFGAAYWMASRKDKKAGQDANAARLAVVESQLALLQQSIQPISVAFQSILIKQLTHYHTPKLDALLKKLGPPFALSNEEEEELITELKLRTQEVAPTVDESERVSAAMLPYVMQRVKLEREELARKQSLILVAVPHEPEK
jgi:hypothetical protein